MKSLKDKILEKIKLKEFLNKYINIYEADDASDEMDLDALDDAENDANSEAGPLDDNAENNSADDSTDDSTDKKDSKEDEEKEKLKLKKNIKFNVWKEPKKKIDRLHDNKSYQKIEYKFKDTDKKINIHFLLGHQDDGWKLWAGVIGVVSYDDDPYCDLDAKNFKDAILNSLDKIINFIQEVKDDPENWVQFYKN